MPGMMPAPGYSVVRLVQYRMLATLLTPMLKLRLLLTRSRGHHLADQSSSRYSGTTPTSASSLAMVLLASVNWRETMLHCQEVEARPLAYDRPSRLTT